LVVTVNARNQPSSSFASFYLIPTRLNQKPFKIDRTHYWNIWTARHQCQQTPKWFQKRNISEVFSNLPLERGRKKRTWRWLLNPQYVPP
jgi:hypothetical protein